MRRGAAEFPVAKMAAALLATLEDADSVTKSTPASDPYAAQLDALFADEYSVAELDEN